MEIMPLCTNWGKRCLYFFRPLIRIGPNQSTTWYCLCLSGEDETVRIPPMILLCFCKDKVAVTLCKLSPKACFSQLPLYRQSPGLVSAYVNQLSILCLTNDDLINYFSSHLPLVIKLKHLFWISIFRQNYLILHVTFRLLKSLISR